MALIFHGSRVNHTRFNPKKRHSGEGVGDFNGFYFAENLVGAYWHCCSPLRAMPGEAYVLVCEVPSRFLKRNVEISDAAYRGEVFGVAFDDCDHISVLEALDFHALAKEVSGREVHQYYVENNKAALLGGQHSLLRRK